MCTIAGKDAAVAAGVCIGERTIWISHVEPMHFAATPYRTGFRGFEPAGRELRRSGELLQYPANYLRSCQFRGRLPSSGSLESVYLGNPRWPLLIRAVQTEDMPYSIAFGDQKAQAHNFSKPCSGRCCFRVLTP
jgi:hypothetical protein